MLKIKPIYEDNHLIAINKPASYLVQGDRTGDLPLNEMVKEYIRVTYRKPGAAYLGTVHRLDRPATGVLIFAKTSKALTRMNKMFSDRKLDKKYWILTRVLAPDTKDKLTHYLKKDHRKNVTRVYDKEVKGSKKSVLSYKLMTSYDRVNLYEIHLETGRSHQIRAQMSTVGCPIIGDLKYGAKKPLDDASIALHCRSISFIHPVSKENITIVAPLPRLHIWKPF